MKRVWLLVLPAFAAAGSLLGCQSPAPGPPAARNVSWEVRGANGSFSRGSGESASVSAGHNRLEIKNGEVFANARDAGPVKPGDTVLLDEDGRLTVNGSPR